MDAIEQLFTELNGHEKDYFAILEGISKRVKPKKVMEIGSGWALSAIAWLKNNPEATLVTIDKIPLSDLPIFKKRIDMCDKEFNLWSRIKMINADSKEYVPRMNETFDIVYIDGDHTYAGAKADFDNAAGRVARGGILLCDDVYHYLNYINRDPSDPTRIPEFGVMRAVGEWAKANEKEVKIYPYANGFAEIQL